MRIEGGEIAAARNPCDGSAQGSVIAAPLARAGKPAVAAADGQEFMLRDGAGQATEGQAIAIEIVRETIPGSEPWKRPLARITAEEPRDAEMEAAELAFPAPHDRLEDAGWSDLIEEARSGIVAFAGGALRVTPTPAMTLIDVDGICRHRSWRWPGRKRRRGASSATGSAARSASICRPFKARSSA